MVKRITLEDEFKKNTDMKKEELDSLREWCSKQTHLPHVSDEMLAMFFHSCYFRMEATKTTIDNYYTVRTHVPEFFEDRDPFKTDMFGAEQIVRYFIPTNTTPEGYRVLIAKLNILNPSVYVFANAVKSFLMYADIDACINGTSPGFIIVFDMDGIGLGHLAKLNPMVIKKILYYLQEAMPVRLKGLHFIRIVPFMDRILAMMKPFMKKELFDVLHLHTHDLSTFYKFVPQKIMPQEYGGEDISLVVIHERLLRQLQDFKGWFLQESKQRVDECKRTGKAKNAGDLFGVEGSFKKLDID